MAPSLRPRKARPSYVDEVSEREKEDEEDEPAIVDEGSGDDFQLADNGDDNAAENESDVEEISAEDEAKSEEATLEIENASSPSKRGRKRKWPKRSVTQHSHVKAENMLMQIEAIVSSMLCLRLTTGNILLLSIWIQSELNDLHPVHLSLGHQ